MLPLEIRDLENVSQDSLSEESRKARKALLFLGVVCLGVSFGGILPAKISALGIDFTNVEQQAIIILLGATTAFYLLSFHVHSRADYYKRSLLTERAVESIDEEEWRKRSDLRELLAPRYGQRLVDAKLPKLLGLLAIWSVLYVNPKFSPFYEIWAPANRYIQETLGTARTVAFDYQKGVASDASTGELWRKIGKLLLIVLGILIVCAIIVALVFYIDNLRSKRRRALAMADKKAKQTEK